MLRHKSTNGKRGDRCGGAASGNQFSHDIADPRAKLETGTTKAERIMQTRFTHAAPHDGQIIRKIAFDTGPDADHVQLAQGRCDPLQLPQLIERVFRPDIGAFEIGISRAALTTAEDDIAAWDLAKIQRFQIGCSRYPYHGLE